MSIKKREKNQKIVLITGGTKGIGKAFAQEYLTKGDIVYTTYSSDENAANKLKKETPDNLIGNLNIFKCPVDNIEKTKALFKKIAKEYSRLDILINNAAKNADSFLVEMKTDQWKKILDINLKGAMNTSYLAIELMKNKNNRKHIINISSISATCGRAGQSNYASTKGGLIGFTKIIAKKYSKYNINSICIIPGLIDTEMADGLSEKITKAMTDVTFLKRKGYPKEISNMVIELTNNKEYYISGSCINLDGGFFK